MRANDPSRKPWVPVPKGHGFSIQNLPFGVFSKGQHGAKGVGVAIGDHVVDLSALAGLGYLDGLGLDKALFSKDALNPLLAHGKEATRALRNRLSDLLEQGNTELQSQSTQHEAVLLPQGDVQMHMPVVVGDYTDFYSSEDHARNVGTMFRDPNNALLPNWKHIPVGYHGRASSIVVSGTPVHRPKGQQRPDPEAPPVFGPCKLLDFELEMAFVTFDGKPLGQNISPEEADDFIFGMCLFNDWSARDIQTWEYVPLGPFLSKNFGSSISPWIVTLDALEPFRVSGSAQDPPVFPYLTYQGDRHLDIPLEVEIVPAEGKGLVVSRSNYRHMYWTMAQQLAHHTVNGCNVRAGDMMASGTISGPEPTSYGSMLEISWKGTKPLDMPDGSQRRFIQDGDTVIMRGQAEKDGVVVGFGEVASQLLPALP